MKYEKNKILTPTYDLCGSPTELTVCAHESAHAVMRHYSGLDITDIEIYRNDSSWPTTYSGHCYGSSIEPNQEQWLNILAAGYAWEWRNSSEIMQKYKREAKPRDFSSKYNDCSRIHNFIIKHHQFDVRADQEIEDYYAELVTSLFLNAWQILEQSYLPTITQIAHELSKVDRLPAEKVEEIIKRNC